MESVATENKLSFQLKGGLYTLTAVVIHETDLDLFSEQLLIKLQQAPKFFENAPVIIDLQKIKLSDNSLDFSQLAKILRQHKLIPVGVRGGSAEQHAQAINANFAILAEQKLQAEKGQSKRNAEAKPSPTATTTTTQSIPAGKIITQPVRSGQQVYAPNGDLIVMSHVSHGAELLADGHIHVYGRLKGRALAGINGNTEARVFCQHLEAELISIAGHYQMTEDMMHNLAWMHPATVRLDQDHIVIDRLVG